MSSCEVWTALQFKCDAMFPFFRVYFRIFHIMVTLSLTMNCFEHPQWEGIFIL